MMTKGMKSSEFWITVVLTVIGALLSAGVFPDESVYAKIAGAVLAAGSSMGYSLSRGIAKAGRD